MYVSMICMYLYMVVAYRSKWVSVEMVPLFTMVGIALGLGVVTMYRETMHSPTVLVSEKARVSLQEIEDPINVHHMGQKFVTSSPLRNVSQVEPFGRT